MIRSIKDAVKGAAANGVAGSFGAHQRPPTASFVHARAGRWLVMVLSVVNVLAATTTLVVIWKTTANAGTPLLTRINGSMSTGGSLLLAAVVFLIAWRGGDQPPNLVIALAFAFAGSNNVFLTLLEQLRANATISHVVAIPTFILGAGFFILASARFPRKLTPQTLHPAAPSGAESSLCEPS